MKDEFRRNASHPQQKTLNQYQVHEDVKELFLPEQPIREDDEYFIESGKIPETYLLPPNQKPLTLQSVLRPNGPNKQLGSIRPHYRRPAPPEIKLRRPSPPSTYQKGNGGYPLPMPNPLGSHGMHKKPPMKIPNSRIPPNMNRPPMSGIPPMKAMPPLHYPKPLFNQGPLKHISKLQNGPVPTIIMAKPISNSLSLPTQSQTMDLGHTDIIANHVVKSQITLPNTNDAIAQPSIPQTFINKPGQIILGKPMENPVPLDQQMTQTKQNDIRTAGTTTPQYFPSSTIQVKNEYITKQQNDIKSSDFIGESVETSSLTPAVNTGFKPDSIVVESGFKPIIREPLMAAEDRIAVVDGGSNRREDTDIEEDYEESPQYISNHAYPSDKITESFEPMFIPSPPDHLLPTNDRTKEIFPSNHAKENRPHPVYVKTEEQLNALFSKNNLEKYIPSDLVMESDRVSPHYLPPDLKLHNEHSQKLSTGEQTFTTYDGKTVSADTLTSVPATTKNNAKLFSSKLPANTELLLKTPQFGPFKGEIPPPVAAHISKDAIQTQSKGVNLHNARTTHLKLVNPLHESDELDVGDLKAEGSENHEVESETLETEEDDIENSDEYPDHEEDAKVRKRRDTKTTQFEMGEIVEQIQTNGHSIKNQMDFEMHRVSASGSNIRLYWMTQIVLLILCLKVY